MCLLLTPYIRVGCTKVSHNCILRTVLLIPSSAQRENMANCDRSSVWIRDRAAEANGFVQCNSTPKYLKWLHRFNRGAIVDLRWIHLIGLPEDYSLRLVNTDISFHLAAYECSRSSCACNPSGRRGCNQSQIICIQQYRNSLHRQTSQIEQIMVHSEQLL